MADYTIKAQTREVTGKKLKSSREQGLLPAVVYGAGQDNVNLFLNKNDFIKVYDAAGESSIIDLVIDEKDTIPTLIKTFDADPKSTLPIHVNFQKVDMNKKIAAAVNLVFEGESPAAKNLGGTLVKKRDYIEIEALPSDLIHEIVVDLSSLETFDDAIHIGDLKVPETVEILDELSGLVAKVEEPQAEEETPTETVSAADIPTVDGEKKEEGEEGGDASPDEKKDEGGE